MDEPIQKQFEEWVGPGAQFSLGSFCGSPSQPTLAIWFYF